MEREEDTERMVPEKADRIYDTLARIFSGYSECVAIAQIGETVYIAANEVKTKSNSLKGPKLITDSISCISDFLRDPSEDLSEKINNFTEYRDTHQGQEKQVVVKIEDVKPNPTAKETVFCELVSPLEREKSALKQSASLYTSQIHIDALKHAIQGHTAVSLSQIKESVGHNEAIGGHAYLAAMSQWDHLGKAINFFGPGSAKKEFPKLAWVYDEHDNVHAEMKILNQLLEDISAEKIGSGSKVYIGISKSCCFHCHHTLESAKQALKENGIEITLAIRDSHDVSFGATKDKPQPKWQFPSIIRKQNLVEYSIFIQKIIPLIKERSVQAFKDNPSFVDTTMGANYASSSSAGEPNYAALHKQHLLDLKQALEKTETIIPKDSFLQGIDIVAVGLLLHDQESFEILFDIDVSLNAKDAEKVFYDLLISTGQNPEAIFNFLKDPRFCGEKIAHCFSNLGRDVLTFAPRNLASTSIPSTSPPAPPPSTPIENSMQIKLVIHNPPTTDVPGTQVNSYSHSLTPGFDREKQKPHARLLNTDDREKPSSTNEGPPTKKPSHPGR